LSKKGFQPKIDYMKVEDSTLDTLGEIPQRRFSKENVSAIRAQLTSRIAGPLLYDNPLETKTKNSRITPGTNFSTLLQDYFGPHIDVVTLNPQNATIEDKKRLHQLKKDLEEAQRWIQVLLQRICENEIDKDSDSKLTRILHRVLNIK